MSEKRIAANKARRVDITGIRFSRLTTITYIEDDKKYLCLCDCGGYKKVRTAALKNGNTKSCGCLQKEKPSDSATQQHKNLRASRGLPKDLPISRQSVLARHELKWLTKQTFERDSFTCVLCSHLGGKLQAHHIDSWSEHPEKREDSDNLVTLCKDCHYRTHNYNWFAEPDYGLNILLRGYVSIMKEKINEPL